MQHGGQVSAMFVIMKKYPTKRAYCEFCYYIDRESMTSAQRETKPQCYIN